MKTTRGWILIAALAAAGLIGCSGEQPTAPAGDVLQSAAAFTAAADTDTVANTPPTCDAGGPYAAAVVGDTVRVQLDASASTDADGDTLSFAWAAGCDGAAFDDSTSATPTLTLTGDCLCADAVSVTVSVFDGTDASVCGAEIALEDRRPPVIEVSTEPYVLWPPDHRYVTITPDVFLTHYETACGVPLDMSRVHVIEVRSDEPDDAIGDGSTMSDIVIECPNVVKLRAERMGGGNGRVYTIRYRIDGDGGWSAEAVGRAVVPHDASGADAIEDADGGYGVLTDCGEGR